MQELIEAMVKEGLSHEQAEESLHAISEWLEENYPVAGTLVSSWIKSQSIKVS